MTRYHVSTDASRDIEEVFVYWAERAGLKVADRLIDAITERFWLLGENPEAGRPADEVAAGVRCFPAVVSSGALSKRQRGAKPTSERERCSSRWPAVAQAARH